MIIKLEGYIRLRDIIARSKTLGTFHREVWRYHDLEAYEKLANSVQALLVGLKIDPQQAKAASEHIKNAYICADKAVEAMNTENPALEHRMYAEAADYLKAARTLIQLKVKGGEYEAKWWYAFRHRDEVEVGHLLYEELLYNTFDPEFALLGAYYLFAAGRYHSEKNWEQVERFLQKYWQAVLERNYCFIAGGL